jgi:hypothetical protein
MTDITDAQLAQEQLLSLCNGLAADCERIARWQCDIALILDHPSVFMGGPSRGNLKRATKILEYLAAQRLSREEISEAKIAKAAKAIGRTATELGGHTPGRWRVYIQDVADKEQAKKELCDLIEGTPNFQPRLVYVTDDDWNLAVCVTGCGEKSEANARAIASIPDMVAEIDRLYAVIENKNEACRLLNEDNDRLRAINAELCDLVKLIAAIPTWRDTYPDSLHDKVVGGRAETLFTPDQIREARAILAKAKADETL